MPGDDIGVSGDVTITVHEPDGTTRRHGENVTCVGMHQVIAESLLTPEQAPDMADRPDVISVGQGNDEFTSDMHSLNSELGRTALSSSATAGTDDTETVFTAEIAEEEFAGEIIRELGLMTDATGRLWNIYRVSPPIDKHDRMRLTVQVDWTVADI